MTVWEWIFSIELGILFGWLSYLSTSFGRRQRALKSSVGWVLEAQRLMAQRIAALERREDLARRKGWR